MIHCIMIFQIVVDMHMRVCVEGEEGTEGEKGRKRKKERREEEIDIFIP